MDNICLLFKNQDILIIFLVSRILTKETGFKGYLNETNLQTIYNVINNGDKKARKVLSAFVKKASSDRYNCFIFNILKQVFPTQSKLISCFSFY